MNAPQSTRTVTTYSGSRLYDLTSRRKVSPVWRWPVQNKIEFQLVNEREYLMLTPVANAGSDADEVYRLSYHNKHGRFDVVPRLRVTDCIRLLLAEKSEIDAHFTSVGDVLDSMLINCAMVLAPTICEPSDALFYLASIHFSSLTFESWPADWKAMRQAYETKRSEELNHD